MKALITILIICFTVIIIPATAPASTASELVEFYDPRVEVADLVQNGSLTNPYIYNLTHDFSYVEKINWVLVFADAQIDFTLFDGTAPLTNGINVLYNSISLVDNKNITNNHELAHFAFNMEVLSDEQSPKDRVIIIQWLLTSFIPNGIQITPTKTIHIYIQDDLTALASLISFTATFKGYKINYIQNTVVAEQFDLIKFLSNAWDSIGSTVIIALLFILGVLMIWITIKRIKP